MFPKQKPEKGKYVIFINRPRIFLYRNSFFFFFFGHNFFFLFAYVLLCKGKLNILFNFSEMISCETGCRIVAFQ